MKLTKEWLEKKLACRDGYGWYLENGTPTVSGTVQKLIASKKTEWANWLISRAMEKNDCVRYAIFSARSVLKIYEDKYPDDFRPRRAIEAAESYVVAGDAAGDAAWEAAGNAAGNAARAARDAARAAWEAAWDAAGDAAWAAGDAAGGELKMKIIKYGLSLLKKSEGC